jgi:peptidoglycan/LPS O-acetylase OafA/YrhL
MLPSIAALDEVRTYKPFIDGLRAIAILTVVASHVDFPGLGGGYVGVDIFFVISGYLIINQIIADIQAKRFSLFDFYARRAFRILPAFLLVMVTCLALATTVFVQFENKEFSESFFLSTIMVANHHFMAHQGYFDMAAFTKPFLHMWSLSVEEQFYLVTPLILLCVTAVSARVAPENIRKHWVAVTLGLGFLSFAACVVFTFPPPQSNVSFYIMPTRGWEFILGGMAPSLITWLRRWPAWISDCLAITGIAAIAFAVISYDADTLYPSYRAGLPALGAMFIIAGGLAKPRNSVARALSTWPMVRIGLVSYAWYLWHWPLISFIRSMNYGERDFAKEMGALAVSLVLAALTYRFIELPVRRWRSSHLFRSGVVVAIGTASCVLIASVGYLWALRIAPQFLPKLTGLDPIEITNRDYPAVTHRGILLGDSHAGVLGVSFQEYARRAGALLTVISSPGCPPLLRTAVINESGAPVSFCTSFYQRMSFAGAEFAIIAARWNFYLNLPPSDPFDRSYSLAAIGAASEPANNYDVMAMGLAAMIGEVKRSGVKRVVIVGPVPEFPWYVPHCVMRAIRVGTDGCLIARAAVEARRKRIMETLRRVIAGLEFVRLIDPIDLFCTATECRPHNGKDLFFSDTSHLSTAGAERLYKANEHDFLWALTGYERR